MKIAIFQPHLFSKGELRLLKVLENDKDFWAFIYVFRKELRIPDNGYESSKKGKIIINVGKRKLKISLSYLKLTLIRFKLPISWFDTLFDIVFFNLATPPNRDKYPLVDVKIENFRLVITVREKISPTKLFQNLRKRKIDQQLKKLPKISLGNIRDFELRKKMFEMEKEDKPFKEIANELQEHKAMDDKQVAIYNDRFQEVLESKYYRLLSKVVGNTK